MGRVPIITENKIQPIILIPPLSLSLSLSLSQEDQLWQYPFLQISVFERLITTLEISISYSKGICSCFEISI